MTEQEARAEAEAILKPLAKRHQAKTSVGYVEESYVEYWAAVKALAGWRSRLSSRVVEAAPSDTDRPPATPIERPGVTVDKTLGELLNVGGDSEANATWQARMQDISEAEGRAFRSWANRDVGKLAQIEGFIAGRRTSRPVQVEVTDEMVERAADAIERTWAGGRHPNATRQEFNRARARAALTAALGGGDHAE